MGKTSDTLVTVATYNEIENLPKLAEEVFAVAPSSDLLVVDDNSPDGTGRWCDEQAAINPRINCVHRSGKLGLGSAIVAAMKYAIEHDYKYMLNMDADFSHHPRYVPDLIQGMENYQGHPVDVMIGSRYIPGGGTEGWPLKRRLMSKGVNVYARALMGLKPKDCSGGFRCYRVEKLKSLDLNKIRSRGYSFQEEILYYLKRAGAKFGESPIIFADRERGLSKINSKEAYAALGIIFRLGMKNWVGV